MTEPTPERRAELRALAEKGWRSHLTVHGDPWIVEGPSDGRIRLIAVVDTSPDDYGRANCLALGALLEALPALLDIADERDALRETLRQEREERDRMMQETALALRSKFDAIVGRPVCHCGEYIDAHNEGSGHSAVDHWPQEIEDFYDSLRALAAGAAGSSAPEPQGDYAALNERLAATAKKEVPRG